MPHCAIPAVTALCALLAMAPATRAAPAAAPQAETVTGALTVQYDGYAHGLIALKLRAALTLTPTGYSARLTYHTAGFVGFMVHNDSDSQVAGRFDGDQAVPLQFTSTGTLRGTARETRLHFDNGRPVIDTLLPPAEGERSLVPPAQTQGAIDTLSAMALLVRKAGATSSCDGGTLTFDGRRLTRLAAHTTGPEALAATEKSKFAGLTLRCDFDGTQLAGFIKGEDEASLRKPRHGTAWFARLVPGAPPLPVRVVFDHRLLGEVTLYLTGYTATPGPVAPAERR